MEWTCCGWMKAEQETDKWFPLFFSTPFSPSRWIGSLPHSQRVMDQMADKPQTLVLAEENSPPPPASPSYCPKENSPPCQSPCCPEDNSPPCQSSLCPEENSPPCHPVVLKRTVFPCHPVVLKRTVHPTIRLS